MAFSLGSALSVVSPVNGLISQGPKGFLGGLNDMFSPLGQTSGTESTSVQLGEFSNLGKQSQNQMVEQLALLLGLSRQAPVRTPDQMNQSDIIAGKSAQRDFASFLGQQSFIPGEQQLQAGQQFANAAFAPQEQQLQQQYQKQVAEANKQATRLGRSTSDPFLQATLRKQVMADQGALQAQKTQYSAQFAQDLLGKQIGARGQQADILGNLGTAQANENQQNFINQNTAQQNNLANLVNAYNLVSQQYQFERNFQLGAANRSTISTGQGSGLAIAANAGAALARGGK